MHEFGSGNQVKSHCVFCDMVRGQQLRDTDNNKQSKTGYGTDNNTLSKTSHGTDNNTQSKTDRSSDNNTQ